MRASMRCTYPPSSPGSLPWRHLHDCSVISAPARPYSSLNPDPLAFVFSLLALFFCCVPPFIPPRNRAHPPVGPLSLSQPILIFPVFARTCTCIKKAVVSRTEVYLTLILPLPRSPPPTPPFVPPGYGREEPNLCDAA